MSETSGTLLQAMRGPVLLMTVGALFAWDHYGNASFWRTWPAILIIVGIMKLAERYSGRPKRVPFCRAAAMPFAPPATKPDRRPGTDDRFDNE